MNNSLVTYKKKYFYTLYFLSCPFYNTFSVLFFPPLKEAYLQVAKPLMAANWL